MNGRDHKKKPEEVKLSNADPISSYGQNIYEKYPVPI